jgi:hypothetical protein
MCVAALQTTMLSACSPCLLTAALLLPAEQPQPLVQAEPPADDPAGFTLTTSELERLGAHLHATSKAAVHGSASIKQLHPWLLACQFAVQQL